MPNAINNPGMPAGPAVDSDGLKAVEMPIFVENPREAPEINFQLAFKILLC